MAELGELLDQGQHKYKHTKWLINGIIYRDDVYDDTVDKLNDSIEWLRGEKGATYNDPNARLSSHESANDGVHLNVRGGAFFVQLMLERIKQLLESEN
jgi:hypothetical protein